MSQDLPEFIRASDLTQTATLEAACPSTYVPWRKDAEGQQWYRRVPSERMQALFGVPVGSMINAEAADDDLDDDDLFFVADDEEILR